MTSNPSADQGNRDNVRKLYEAGLSVRQIARSLDLSTQRVYQILDVLDLPPPTHTGRLL